MKLLVGLGNPGPEYANNRHNVGFHALDAVAARWHFGPWKKRLGGITAEGDIAGHRTVALKPLTYMNDSGRSVGEASRCSSRFWPRSPTVLPCCSTATRLGFSTKWRA